MRGTSHRTRPLLKHALGPYSAEGPTIAALHGFIHEHGHRFDGRHHKHHEIYLSDPRRTAPERLKTIIRQPVSPA
jgi:hypothetical protein